MKKLYRTSLIAAIWLIVLSGNNVIAQSCCGPNDQFANLSENKEFKEHHELKSKSDYKLMGKMVSIDVPNAEAANAYYIPSKEKSNKWLVVFHEWWGLNDHIKSESDEWYINLENVNVIALDLYDGKVATTREEAGKYMQTADKSRIHNILDAAKSYMGPEAEIATIGWCFGGGWSMQAALTFGEQAKGCVIYYGMPENDMEKLSSLNCEVLGIFAEKDKWINTDVVGKYEAAMKKSGKEYETHWFNAVHAFANPSNEKYDAKLATEASEITLKYLQEAFK